jgi:succinate-acetate transporter protein
VPLTIGMAGLAIASFVDSGFELQWIARSQAVQVGLILVSVPFTLQLTATVFSYLARDGAAGASLGVLASSWLALGLIHLVSTPGRVSGALGLMLLASGGVLALSAAAVAKAKPLPALVFVAAALRFALAGIYQLSTTAAWQHASGILGLVITALAGYCLLAFELEGQSRAPVVPTFRRGRGAAAIQDGAGTQLDHVVHEPGVRQTT